MSPTVRLGDSFTILVGEAQRPLPPDRAVAVLLLGLLAAGEGWTPRAEVARRLYPESDDAAARNALRQTAFRLRRWLGNDVLESRAGLLRLVPGSIVHRDGDFVSQEVLAWLDHPWADAVAEERRPRPSVSHLDDLAKAIESAAGFDVDAARGILVGGAALVFGMPLSAAMRLIDLTRPRDALAPLAYEHVALRAEFQLHAMAYGNAKAGFSDAYRLAVGRQSRPKAFRAACMSAFVHIEAGDMSRAATWLERCAELEKAKADLPLLANVRAAFLWNSGRVDEAVALMRRSAPDSDVADGERRLHYWTNFAALAAESGDAELAIQADEAARGLARPGVHAGYLYTLELARATGLMSQGRLDESLRAFERLRRGTAVAPPDNRAYVEEGYAEALARAGEVRRAAEVWKRAERERLATSARLTPRLAARKALILRAA